jgi:Na+-translocating ferredoxin:NAD+ oxidoreductase RnfA subunit
MKTAFGEALSTVWGIATTCAAALVLEIYLFPVLEAKFDARSLRAPVVLVAAFLITKAAEKFGKLPYRDTLIVAAAAGSLLAMEGRLLPGGWMGFALGIGLGTAFVGTLAAGIMERLDLSSVPQGFRGAPVFFVSLSLLALVWGGFQGFFR